MSTWTLVIIVLFSYRGGVSVDHIDGFKSFEACNTASKQIYPPDPRFAYGKVEFSTSCIVKDAK